MFEFGKGSSFFDMRKWKFWGYGIDGIVCVYVVDV